ncbi:MAG TPA: putative metal-binding motif-containing protein [Gemmatimonadaceae bacterium]|nr:putative metal-binding motif-containing protein [Gemmatimonadaceae bacterium]
MRVETAVDAVTILLGTNPAGATLEGTLTVNAVAGIATFTDVSLDAVGSGFTLVATSGSLTSATSVAFDVTLSLADVDGDGFSPNSGDCNDLVATTYPGAEDRPDGDFVDSNCDGIDGDIAQAVFASPSGFDAGNCGSQGVPCRTIGFAIGRAMALGRRDVYAAAGDYVGTLNLVSGISVHGAFGSDWARGPGMGETRILPGGTITAGTGTAQHVTVYGENISALTYLTDLTVLGPNAVGTYPSGAGRNSYAVFLRASSTAMRLERLRIESGNGSAGLAGVDATDASATAAASGAAGEMGGGFVITCDATTRGAGGSGAAADGDSTWNGGRGGDGGAMDTACDEFGNPTNATASHGAPGSDAPVLFPGTAGVGGAGGFGSLVCGIGNPGSPGRTANGAGGVAGGGNGAIVDGVWAPRSGASGTVGLHGSGGGGGGGGGGCDSGPQAYGAGGGGGGAGGANAPTAGTGGGGGGGSFGVYLIDASPQLTDLVILRGVGGSGGAGGDGGRGQAGGAGGPGGAANGGRAGGAGGDGGHGGHSGGGAGGSGGRSVGLFRSVSSGPVLSGVAYEGGAGGPGGAGGAAATGIVGGQGIGAPGEAGTSGPVNAVVVCSSPTSC